MSQSERPFSVGSEKEVKLDSPKSPKKESVEKIDNEKLKIQTELAIKQSRITPSTPSEQHSELLHFIARKERKVLELREELKRHEEELRLLKKQWETNITKNIDEESNSNSPSSPASLYSITNNSEGEPNNFMNGLGKGIAGVIGGIQKVKESELTQEKISQIKSVVADVANSQPVQQTRRKTADFTSNAWHNLSKGISTLASSETIQNAKKKTLKTVYTINEALTSPSTKTTNNTTEDSSSVIYEDDKTTMVTTPTTTTITSIISQSPSEEIEDPILHVIGDDFSEFI
ncbi:hypothetical protein RclHR1_00180038 [Rhizophagus clarus]|uniref:Uncharacterized protein n=1 Tax=Rhizophagus clarus TaxID=94130 RepID=A0A2Z6QLJ8_9GLOM|nr:hypothetical protein RclHR1_00180038 [Rhizophagus clarus]GES73063.1 hypothetical protein RCL_jg2123.t1 [Rhizophagus clarus]